MNIKGKIVFYILTVTAEVLLFLIS